MVIYPELLNTAASGSILQGRQVVGVLLGSDADGVLAVDCLGQHSGG